MTAVEWLYENLLDNPMSNEDVIYNINVFEQAKDMEREQLIDCGNSCAMKQHIHIEKINDMTMEQLVECSKEEILTFGKQYYNETFKKL